MKIRYQTIYRLVMALMICTVLILTASYIIFRPDASTNQKERAHLIGASYMTMNNEFYEILNEQISHRVEAEGDRIILRDPALSTDRQKEQIEEMLDMGIDVLILTPVNDAGMTEVLKRAHDMGVRIIVVDSNVSDTDLVDCTIVSDNYKAGCIVGDYFLSKHKESNVVIMTHETAMSGRERVRGFLDTIRGHDGIKVVEQIPCEGQLEIAMPKLEELIEQGVEFDSVFCLNDLASMGAAAALESHGLLGSVEIYGVDASPDAKQLIYEGRMMASAAQFPTRIGDEASNAVYRLLSGEEVENYISVPVELVTRENVEQHNVDRWQ